MKYIYNSSARVCKNWGTTSYKKSLLEVTPMLLYEVVSLVRSCLCSKWPLNEVTVNHGLVFMPYRQYSSQYSDDFKEITLFVNQASKQWFIYTFYYMHVCFPLWLWKNCRSHLYSVFNGLMHQVKFRLPYSIFLFKVFPHIIVWCVA